jgi:hypothetical protein
VVAETGGEDAAERLRRAERELRRARRSRQVLMEVLAGLEASYRAEIQALEAENRRLRRLLARRARVPRPAPDPEGRRPACV